MQLLHSKLELAVQSGFVYAPLLFDPDIEREIQERSTTKGPSGPRASGESSNLVELAGRLFIQSVNIESVLENYERIDPDHYEQLKRACQWSTSVFPSAESLSANGKLLTIILKIMPYFIRKGRGLERRRLSEEELLDLICSKIDLSPSRLEQADKYLDSGPLLQRLKDLNALELVIEPLQDGLVTSEALLEWFQKALKAQILDRERARLQQELREREGLDESKRKHIAALLYIAEKGSFELDGFGFTRIGSRDDYLIYKHTGEYIIKDYYARNYRFPDCRVGISTAGPLRPLVVETYKHPFLIDYAPNQEICFTGYEWPDEFTADNIIKLLEAGINALLYGYDARRRNGYHSLDPTLSYVKTIEFDEYRV